MAVTLHSFTRRVIINLFEVRIIFQQLGDTDVK